MTYKRVKPCKKCLHYKACITANPDMVKKTFECEYFEDTDLFKKEIKSEAVKEFISCVTDLCYKEFENDLEVAHTFASILTKAQKEMVGEYCADFCPYDDEPQYFCEWENDE